MFAVFLIDAELEANHFIFRKGQAYEAVEYMGNILIRLPDNSTAVAPKCAIGEIFNLHNSTGVIPPEKFKE